MTNKKYQFYLNLAGKTILSITCAAMLTLSCRQTVLASEQNSSNSNSSVSDSSASTVIGTEAAQNFAFADAGVDPLSVETVYTEYDYDDGEFLYEVDFTVEDTEYEYQIQAYEGSVLKKSIDYLGLKKSVSPQTDTSAAITLEEAKELALADTELTDEELELITFTKEKTDEDDGIAIYDIEFYTDTAKYEYEISTRTGDILELSIDYRFTAQDLANNADAARTSAGSSSASYISLDEAKNIALEYAGLSASDVTFKKAKLDKEHGTMVYEIEFYQGRIEYECEINAVTGTIIEFEIDD
ncbi:MAG: PepSY domain-containing protein [Lachnospiraceae bacterium]|nr:PepSY domain-containing protein [Lachnospiraceae bacterium]